MNELIETYIESKVEREVREFTMKIMEKNSKLKLEVCYTSISDIAWGIAKDYFDSLEDEYDTKRIISDACHALGNSSIKEEYDSLEKEIDLCQDIEYESEDSKECREKEKAFSYMRLSLHGIVERGMDIIFDYIHDQSKIKLEYMFRSIGFSVLECFDQLDSRF